MRLLISFCLLGFLILAAQSCKPTSEIVPSDPEGLMKADIGEGKVIYMRDCTRCHEQHKVENYTSAQWSNILPRMVIKAQLDETKSRQVKAYVEWELEND